MSSKKSRDSSKSKHSSKDESREDRHRRSSKDYRSTYDENEAPSSSTHHRDKSESHRSKSKHGSSSKSAAYADEEAQALAEEKEERRRRKKQQQQQEEEERLRREQEENEEEERRRRKKQQRKQQEEEEYEIEQRRKKDKNRDIENGDGRKHKSSRDKSPPADSPPPPPTKHKTKAAYKDDNYSDDFEQNYDDDFDEAPSPTPFKKPSRSTYNSSPPPSSSTKKYPPIADRDDIQVYTNSRRFHSHDISDRVRRRYKDLSRLIVLDRQTFHILEMAPMPAHAAYMRDIRLNDSKKDSSSINPSDDGTNWTSSVKTQTNDDAEHVQSQTEEIDTRVMWTQHPCENSNKACGSGNTNMQNMSIDENKTRENEDLLRMLRLETDLGRYQTFVINAGKLIFALLDEQQQAISQKSKSKRSKESDEHTGMQHKSNLDFSSGLTILPGLSFKSDAMIAAVCFCQDKPEQIAVFYEPIYTTSYGAIYNVREPENALRIFTCEASVRCCSSSSVYVFAGCQDGSIVLFDTSEPSKYKSNSKESIPSSPTFSTANIQFNERHSNEVVRVVPLRISTGATGSFSLASLDKDGLIIIWSVVELVQSDEAGSIADLGLKPGGRVRMTQTSFMQIKQSIHMARDSIQAYDLSYPINDVDHLYVASNANAVYHLTRYGEMGSPSKFRISSDLESQIEVTCLSFNTMINKLLLIGTGHGQINLYFTGRDEPILTLPQAFRSSSAVLSCTWSTGRPSVFFAHDSQGYIKYWDLMKDQYQPIGSLQIENLSHFVLSTSDQYETAFALVIKQQSSKIEVHQLKESFASRSSAFQDNFKTLIKELMSNV